jgi:hypothetical protein
MRFYSQRTLSVLVSLAMVASCKASKEAATEPAGATAAAAAAKRRVELGLGQAGERGVEGKTKAVVVVAKQQAARKRVPAMLAVVTRRCMRSCSEGMCGGWGGFWVGVSVAISFRRRAAFLACVRVEGCSSSAQQGNLRQCLHSVQKDPWR